MRYWEDRSYWRTFEYDRTSGCACYGGPGQYSWGWDDFGNHMQPYDQITGYGMYEARFE